MHCAILIIGSLLWDSKTTGRAEWRASRLDVGACVPVRAPIHYGRKSRLRGNTYTMVFRRGEPAGQAVLAPCKRHIETITELIAEAQALWQAEAPNTETTAISSNWGCVGALFRPNAAHQEIAAGWTAHFQKAKAQCVSVVNESGLFDIGWPYMPDGLPADFDVILATANKPQVCAPDDSDIWRRIEEKSPCWLEKKKREYQQAIEILRAEVANGAQG